jgi:hypothetical protein
MEDIAMKDQYFTAIAVTAVGIGLAAYSISSQAHYCPQPWTASVNALFAPCQALYGAVGPRLAGSVDPFLQPNGG